MSSVPYYEIKTLIRLSADEAVVLFELLSRWSEDKQYSTPPSDCYESTAEGAVLNSLLCELETQLIAPFSNDYLQILEGARKRLEHRWDYPTLRG